MMLRTLLAVILLSTISAGAALVTQRMDVDDVFLSTDGVLGSDEYGPGNTYSYAGGGAGFGGQLGPATMYMNSDPATLYIAFTGLGVPGNEDQYIIYLNTKAGGFQPNGLEMSDGINPNPGDGGRRNTSILSLDGTETVTFNDGVAKSPDYAIVFNNRVPGSGGFNAVFSLSPSGTAHGTNPRTVAGLGSSTVEFAIPLSVLGMTAGGTVDVCAVEISGTGFLSNEGMPNPNLPSNPGFNGGTIVYSNFHRFVTSASTASGAMTSRVNATTLRLPQSAPGAASNSYSTADAFPGVTFNMPLCIRSAPGETNRLFIVEQGGVIAVITNLANPSRSVFLDIGSRVTSPGGSFESGLLGFDFHPNYASNGYFYVYYTAVGSGQSNRVARFQVSSTNPHVANPGSELILISQHDDCSNHNGGDVHFGPDGYLYVSLGDEGGGNDDCGNNSQRIDKDFFATILRIDVDKKPGSLAPNHHPAVFGTTNYAIPPDNPFIGRTQFNGTAVNSNNVRTEFYCIGLRNPFRISFDEPTGYLYVGDVGQNDREEVDIVGRGGNYGWKYREGFIATPAFPTPPAGFSNAINPIIDYAHSGASTNTGSVITGGVVYRGNNYPDLFGKYIFSDYNSGNIWALTNNGTNATSFGRLTGDAGISAFGTDPRNGDVLMSDLTGGVIKKLVQTSSSGGFPQTLADTGVFKDLVTLTPHPGIEPYEINVPFWSDNAIKSRWFSVPSTNIFLGFNAESLWTFPTTTVWIKHFELELTNGVASSRRRIETRLLVRNAVGDGGYGVTYRWGTSTTNATLVPDGGLDEPIVIDDAGVIRTQLWRYPSRGECLQCHNAGAGFALSFSTPQMNRSRTYTGDTTNQLLAFQRSGYFNTSVASVNLLRKMEPATNTAASVEHRVRSYLQANCAQCHYPGGPTPAGFDTRLFTSLLSASLIDGTLNNTMGNPANRVIVRNSHTNSMTLTRIGTRGANQMPPLGSTVVDTQAVALIRAWITGEATNYQSFAEWQLAHFGSTVIPDAAASADPDLDGNINNLEYLTDTAPTNGFDAWSFDLNNSGTVGVSFTRLANTGFEVQRTTNLVQGGWSAIDVPANGPIFVATDTPATVSDPASTNANEASYRIRVYRP